MCRCYYTVDLEFFMVAINNNSEIIYSTKCICMLAAENNAKNDNIFSQKIYNTNIFGYTHVSPCGVFLLSLDFLPLSPSLDSDTFS